MDAKKPPIRCPGCGGLIRKLPCIKCQVDALAGSKPLLPTDEDTDADAPYIPTPEQISLAALKIMAANKGKKQGGCIQYHTNRPPNIREYSLFPRGRTIVAEEV